MSRKVKCKATGELGDADEFVKIDGKYYKSQEVYDAMRRDKDFREQAMKIILYDFLHYEVGRPYPTLLNKKYTELTSFYSNEVILETVKEVHDSLEECCERKDFSSEYGKIAYIFAAINSHIGDVYNQKKRLEKQQQYAKARRESENVDLTVSMLNDCMIPKSVSTYKTTRNLSQFLEEGDI